MINGVIDLLAVEAVTTIQITPKMKDKSEEERKKEYVAKKHQRKDVKEEDIPESINLSSSTTYSSDCKLKTFVLSNTDFSL